MLTMLSTLHESASHVWRDSLIGQWTKLWFCCPSSYSRHCELHKSMPFPTGRFLVESFGEITEAWHATYMFGLLKIQQLYLQLVTAEEHKQSI